MLITLLRGRYRITQALGQGGFGKTYLAEDIDRRNAKCVVKQFAPEPGMKSNPGALQKATELFNQEAERLLQLEEHPQIPTLYAYFEENLPQAGNNQEIPYQYLVQQYIKGNTLQEELRAIPLAKLKSANCYKIYYQFWTLSTSIKSFTETLNQKTSFAATATKN